MNIENQLHNNNPVFGTKKVPRYIYHMTSKSNYDSIIQHGFIKMSEQHLHVDEGVYAFDLINFFKRWKTHKDWGHDDLQRTILRHIVKWFKSFKNKEDELVILKIPTSKLDKEKLFVRSLNRLFKFEDSKLKFRDIPYSLQEHLSGNTPACEAPLYKRQKEAIEFIYKDSIPLKDTERIGNIVNVPSLRQNIRFDINPVKLIMESLLEGTQEGKGANLMK